MFADLLSIGFWIIIFVILFIIRALHYVICMNNFWQNSNLKMKEEIESWAFWICDENVTILLRDQSLLMQCRVRGCNIFNGATKNLGLKKEALKIKICKGGQGNLAELL